MNTDLDQAKDDLAYLRSIVDEVAPDYQNLGIIYMWAGVLFGAQCLINYLLLVFAPNASKVIWLLVGFMPTVIFLVINVVYARRDKQGVFGHGAVKKAINAAFTGVGVANVVLAILFGLIAYQKAEWYIWSLFPVVVCAGQGAVWFAITVLRRQQWMGVTAFAWFAASAVLGLVLDNIQIYLLVLGMTLVLCMGVPGFVLSRSIKSDAVQA